MKKILKVDSPNDYARFVDAPVLHPLVSIIHYDELPPSATASTTTACMAFSSSVSFPKTSPTA